MDAITHSDAPDGLSPAQFAAAVDWWRDAGVDLDFVDAARDWLTRPDDAVPAGTAPQFTVPEPPAPAPAPKIGGDGADLPATLAEFTQWWLTDPSLDGGQVFDRVAPRGPAGAELMVLVDHPEPGDSQRLLDGPQGQLLDAILTSFGIAPDAAYVASCLPRHTPMPDWAALAEAGLGRIVTTHVKLAAPQRLIVLGPHISSLLGHDPAKSANPLPRFNHEGANVPVLVAQGLVRLGGRPRDKAALWDAWLNWTG
ncbi:hypothetical protein [Novosphingobium sp.]|uniref:hypothetical protein n=1 Tax=Novosphingobium sp. TaxID=1874826 RepID=UPI002734BF5E|nr:hypothetical protein [Novosphingobium sp.]MDP3905648.1 hypothetical protein [Novosphingobium sp.]